MVVGQNVEVSLVNYVFKSGIQNHIDLINSQVYYIPFPDRLYLSLLEITKVYKQKVDV